MIFPIIGDRKKLLHISTHDAMDAINLKKCLKCTSDTVELPLWSHGIRVIETSQFSTNTNIMTPLPMSADEHKQARTQKLNDSYFTVD